MEKKKKPSSPCTGQLSRLTSSPGGSWRIAELREMLSCLGCEIVENSQQAVREVSVSHPSTEGQSLGSSTGHTGLQVGLLTFI